MIMLKTDMAMQKTEQKMGVDTKATYGGKGYP